MVIFIFSFGCLRSEYQYLLIVEIVLNSEEKAKLIRDLKIANDEQMRGKYVISCYYMYLK